MQWLWLSFPSRVAVSHRQLAARMICGMGSSGNRLELKTNGMGILNLGVSWSAGAKHSKKNGKVGRGVGGSNLLAPASIFLRSYENSQFTKTCYIFQAQNISNGDQTIAANALFAPFCPT
jgi:hypothetical protein